jgi:FAD/FMN-containing dehydrogenase
VGDGVGGKRGGAQPLKCAKRFRLPGAYAAGQAHERNASHDASASLGVAVGLLGRPRRLGLGLGGTITGEHGVGLLKRDFLARELGDVSMRLHRAVKRAFDPQGILNPGKVFSAAPDSAHDAAPGRR